MPRLSEELRVRIREELAKQKISARAAAKLLEWHPSRVYQLLDGTVELSADDIEAFGFVLNLRPTELVRDRGLEFVAEMAPTELRALELIRQWPAPRRKAFFEFIGAEPAANAPPERFARPLKKAK